MPGCVRKSIAVRLREVICPLSTGKAVSGRSVGSPAPGRDGFREAGP